MAISCGIIEFKLSMILLFRRFEIMTRQSYHLLFSKQLHNSLKELHDSHNWKEECRRKKHIVVLSSAFSLLHSAFHLRPFPKCVNHVTHPQNSVTFDLWLELNFVLLKFIKSNIFLKKFMKNFCLSIVVLFVCYTITSAQEEVKSRPYKNWEIGINAGVANFTGEYNMFKDSRFNLFNHWKGDI